MAFLIKKLIIPAAALSVLLVALFIFKADGWETRERPMGNKTTSSIGEEKSEESQYQPMTLSGKAVNTKAEYDIEKIKVAQKVKEIGKGEADISELIGLLNDWSKIAEIEKCRASVKDLKLPADSIKLIQLGASAVASGTCQ